MRDSGGGYVLLHVLEVQVPGRDLGHSVECEVVLGGSSARCPVPSASRGENVMLSVPKKLPEDEDTFHVNVFDSDKVQVGVVVIPVESLSPLEVWNVWYAIDDHEGDGADQLDDSNPPKMHLMLQYVPAQAAAEEDAQAREHRTQDFLLKALQQFQTHLEQLHAHGLPGTQPATHRTQPELENDPPPPSCVDCPDFDEVLNQRLLPFKATITSLETRAKFFDDIEAQNRQLRTSLEEQQARSHELYTKLYEGAKRYANELGDERENLRASEAVRGEKDAKITDLEQEVQLRRAHEDSLAKRVTLMENELIVAQQRCALLDAIEEQLRTLKKETANHLDSRVSLQEQLEGQMAEIQRLQSEAYQNVEERRQEAEKHNTRLHAEKQTNDRLQQQLREYEAAARQSEVDTKAHVDKIESQQRKLTTLESEVTSWRNMAEREKEHRKDLEKRFEEVELAKLHSSLQSHEKTIKQLREESSKHHKEMQVERDRFANLENELANVRYELENERRTNYSQGQQIVVQAELNAQLNDARRDNADLRDRNERLLRDGRKMTEHYDAELKENVKNLQILCQERDAKQVDVGDLSSNLSKANLQTKEISLLQEQTAKSLAAARTTIEQYEDIQQQLLQSQADVRESRASREMLRREMDRVTAKFQEHVQLSDSRAAEIEKVLENRNQEIKLLMYRVQELSSKYFPVKGDEIDAVLAKWVNGYRPAVPFFRLSHGHYLFGRRQILCKISNDKPVFRVGGGFIGFDKFLELYASEELEQLLNYEIDERTGQPKFLEALRVRNAMKESGALEDIIESGPRPTVLGSGAPVLGTIEKSFAPPRRSKER